MKTESELPDLKSEKVFNSRKLQKRLSGNRMKSSRGLRVRVHLLFTNTTDKYELVIDFNGPVSLEYSQLELLQEKIGPIGFDEASSALLAKRKTRS